MHQNTTKTNASIGNTNVKNNSLLQLPLNSWSQITLEQKKEDNGLYLQKVIVNGHVKTLPLVKSPRVVRNLRVYVSDLRVKSQRGYIRYLVVRNESGMHIIFTFVLCVIPTTLQRLSYTQRNYDTILNCKKCKFWKGYERAWKTDPIIEISLGKKFTVHAYMIIVKISVNMHFWLFVKKTNHECLIPAWRGGQPLLPFKKC